MICWDKIAQKNILSKKTCFFNIYLHERSPLWYTAVCVPDFEYLEHIANEPLFVDERQIEYYDDDMICECEPAIYMYSEEVIIPVEYRGKVKKKNRHNKHYHYR